MVLLKSASFLDPGVQPGSSSTEEPEVPALDLVADDPVANLSGDDSVAAVPIPGPSSDIILLDDSSNTSLLRQAIVPTIKRRGRPKEKRRLSRFRKGAAGERVAAPPDVAVGSTPAAPSDVSDGTDASLPADIQTVTGALLLFPRVEWFFSKVLHF